MPKSRTDWDQLALQKFVLFCVYVSHTLSCWATSKQGVHSLWRQVQKMLPLLPKQPGKTHQDEIFCTKALSEELMLSGKTPVTLRDKSSDLFFLDFKDAIDEEIGLYPGVWGGVCNKKGGGIFITFLKSLMSCARTHTLVLFISDVITPARLPTLICTRY